MSHLAEFLLARIDEDEAVARLANSGSPDWRAESPIVSDLAPGKATPEVSEPEVFNHTARWGPARVLAECQAKRRIVEQWRRAEAQSAGFASPPLGPALGHLTVVKFLALPYADHPDYRQEWRP